MRFVVAVVAATCLLAPPARAGVIEDWIGTWTGTATWTDCTAPGPDELSVDIRWRDDAVAIDGAALFDGLGELWPDVVDGGLRATASDVTVTLATKAKATKGKATKGKPAKGKATATSSPRAVAITLSTAAGCTMSATLTRAGTGIAACDDLVALAAASTSCDDVTVDDDPGDEVAGWRGLDRAGRRAAAAQCQRRADDLREHMIAAACLPVDDDPSQIPACNDTWRLGLRINRCDRIDAEQKRSYGEHVASLRRSLRSLHGRDGAAALAAERCQETAAMLTETLEWLGCP
ncbi:MAG: hypothetical protein H6708_18420 [Kofleriaceae bacterium]|nr:hypothetical protein [Myxococcales bacterium]MCB9562384.1 hypothetical protein [Kofleriaceae bacterium]